VREEKGGGGRDLRKKKEEIPAHSAKIRKQGKICPSHFSPRKGEGKEEKLPHEKRKEKKSGLLIASVPKEIRVDERLLGGRERKTGEKE